MQVVVNHRTSSLAICCIQWLNVFAFCPSSDLITFYKCLEHDGLRHSDALDRTVRVLLNGQLTPGVVAHCQKLLEELRSHWHLLPSKRSIYTFLLAELLWTSEERADMTLERFLFE